MHFHFFSRLAPAIRRPIFEGKQLGLALTILALVLASVTSAPAQYAQIYTGFPNGTRSPNPVVCDSSGNIYGTLNSSGVGGGGSPNFLGSVYELSPPAVPGGVWTYTVLWNFGGISDGYAPNSPVTLDSHGNLYGTTGSGGAYNAGILWELSPPTTPGGAWTETHLHDFGGTLSDGITPDGTNPQKSGVVFDSAGDMFGTTSGGGAFGYGIVWEIPAQALSGQPSYNVLHDFGSGGANPIVGPTIDPSGNLWGTCPYNEPNQVGQGVVWELTAPSTSGGLWTYIDMHDFGGTLPGGAADGENPQGGVSFDRNGNAYGTTADGGTGAAGTIWKLSLGNYSVLYNFLSSSPAFEPLAGVTFDAAGNMYGTTVSGGFSGGTLWEMTPGGVFTILHTFAGTGDGSCPTCTVTLDSQGNLYGTANQTTNVTNYDVWQYAMPVALTTARGSSPAMAGGVGVSFAATVALPPTFGGGTVTLASANGSYVQVGGANNESPGASYGYTNVPAGAGTETFTITAPTDLATPTAVVLTASASNAASATLTVTVEPFVQALTMSAAGTNSGETLSGYAYTYEAPGTLQTLNVNASLSGASLTSGPITVAAGQAFSSRITFTMGTVDTTQSGTITASLVGGQSSATTNFSIYAPWLTAMSFSPNAVNAGGQSTLTAMVNAPFASDQTFTATSNKSNIANNVSVTIPAGQTMGSATVSTANFASLSKTAVTFTGTLGTAITGTSTHTAALQVTPYQISSISFPGTTNSGSNAQGTITLTAAAETNLSINLTSSNTALVPNCTVMVPQGSLSATISVPTTFTWGTASPTISLSGSIDGTLTRSGTMKLAEDFISGITVGSGSSTASISELDSLPLSVTLAYAPASSKSVSVNSSNAKEYGTISVTIPSGSATGTTNITPTFNALTAPEVAKLSSGTGSVTITVSPEILSIALSPNTVGVGPSQTMATVTLFEPYTGSLTGTAASNSSIAQVPSGAITMATGTTKVTFTVTTSKRTSPAVVAISINALGYKKSANLTFAPGH